MEDYRNEKKNITEGYSPNYISRTITVIREIMALAKKSGLHKSEAYKDTDYKKPSESVEAIYLTMDELMAMYKAELPEWLVPVRDRFLISAFSGLRFSDSTKITLESVRNGLMYDKNIKTGQAVVVPVHEIIEEIFKKNPDGLPSSVTNQRFNKDIKEVGRLSGIKTPWVHNYVKGGKTITETIEKYKLIVSHTGRRSFATNAILSGIPASAVKQITGHRTDSSFQRYLKATSEESARTIIDHPFFKKPVPAEKAE
jgi:integrase